MNYKLDIDLNLMLLELNIATQTVNMAHKSSRVNMAQTFNMAHNQYEIWPLCEFSLKKVSLKKEGN